MDCSWKSYKKLFTARIPIDEPESQYYTRSQLVIQPESEYHTRSQLLILQHYVSYLETMSEEELPSMLFNEMFSWIDISDTADLTISEPFAHELKKSVFSVPRLKKLPESCSNQYTPVNEFISFQVRLLSHKPDSCGYKIKNVEKGLRFLLTVLGDTSLLDEHQEFENLLAEFEAVANEAGCFVHSLFFLRSDEAGINVLLKHIKLLKANIIKLIDVGPCSSRSTYMTRKTSVVESLLVLDSLVGDLEDLMSRGNSSIAMKNQIKTLHQGLLCLQSFIKAQPSEIGQVRECCMRVGDLAHEAEYLIISFLAGDAPSKYLVRRLIHVNHKIELCRIKLPKITMKHKSGGLEVATYFNKHLQAKRNTEVDGDIVGSEEKMRYMLDQLAGGGAELRVISIFGMAGLGKTTLAKKLYNHRLVNERFDRSSWCVVSQTYSRRGVLANILIHIASELGKDVILKMEEDSLAEHIHKTLKGRRYLIVMDDIWDPNVCDELLTLFCDDGNGSRILFTTRNKDVVPPNSIMYALPSLSEGQCWEILEKRVFNNQPCPPELVKSGRKLLASCGGMPLAVVVLAGVLSTVDKEERAWEEVRRNLSSYILNGAKFKTQLRSSTTTLEALLSLSWSIS